MIKIFVENCRAGHARGSIGIVDTQNHNIFVIKQLANGDWNFKVENLKGRSTVSEIVIDDSQKELFGALKLFLTQLEGVNSLDLKRVEQFGKNYLPFIKNNCFIICNQENEGNFRNRTIIYNHEKSINIMSQYNLSEEMSINTSRGPYKAILPHVKTLWENIINLSECKRVDNIYQAAVEEIKPELDLEM